MDDKLRKVSRRSFLGQVAGGAAGVGALAIVGGGAAQAEDAPDHDLAGTPDGAGGQKSAAQGCSDSDSGRYADGVGRGRRCRPSGSDSDPTDPASGSRTADRDPTDPAQGNGGRACSDRDTGRNADPVGRGRRCAGRTYTGVTDSDSGSTRDPSNYGRRRRRNCSDSDNGRSDPARGSNSDTDRGANDPVGRGRRC